VSQEVSQQEPQLVVLAPQQPVEHVGAEQVSPQVSQQSQQWLRWNMPRSRLSRPSWQQVSQQLSQPVSQQEPPEPQPPPPP
jgi:hypothetical protein